MSNKGLGRVDINWTLAGRRGFMSGISSKFLVILKTCDKYVFKFG